jgi:hypothetical protein
VIPSEKQRKLRQRFEYFLEMSEIGNQVNLIKSFLAQFLKPIFNILNLENS